MNSKITSKYNSAKNLQTFKTTAAPSKKKKLDLIKEYLSSQPDHIKNLESPLKLIHTAIKDFIKITEDYSNNLMQIALKLIPRYSFEGELSQIIQNIMLYFSDILTNLTKKLKEEDLIIKENEVNEILDKFNNHTNNYIQKIDNLVFLSSKYKREIDLYEYYLINKEFNEHVSKGDLINHDDEIISNKKQNKNNIEDDKNNNLSNSKTLEIIKDIDINLTDNKDKLIESQQLFLSCLNESNDLINKIKEFLSEEKTKLRRNIFNFSVCLIESLIMSATQQKESFGSQNDIIKKLIKKIKYEETDNQDINVAPINLKYLEIYQNYLQEKNNMTDNKTNLNKGNSSKFLNSQISNKLKDPKKNVETDDFDINLYQLKRNSNFNQANNKLNKEIMKENLKFMITKLNRVDIIKIFEKIKSTNILLSESDINLIEEETNYNIIHQILISIFINNEKYTENEKDILIKLFEKDKIYIFYFIKVLNDHRTKGNFVLSENTLKYLGELFKYINNLVISKNEMDLFKFIFILSMTYYHISEKNKTKIYLFSYIKDHPDYQKIKFWEDYLNELIKHEINGNVYHLNLNLENKTMNDLNKEEKEKLSNCYFSNFLTTVKAMADFRLDRQFVRDFVEKNRDKYFLSQPQIENVCMIYDISLKENEANYSGDFLDKEKGDKSEDDNKDKIQNTNECKNENNSKDNNIINNEKDKKDNSIDTKINDENKIEKIEKDDNKDKVDNEKPKEEKGIINNEFINNNENKKENEDDKKEIVDKEKPNN